MIEYIKDANNNPVGVMIAQRQENKLLVGFSMLHPNDLRVLLDVNAKLKKINSRIHKLNSKISKGEKLIEIHPIQPVFDKKEALAMAEGKLSNRVNLQDFPSYNEYGIRPRQILALFIARALDYFEGTDITLTSKLKGKKLNRNRKRSKK